MSDPEPLAVQAMRMTEERKKQSEKASQPVFVPTGIYFDTNVLRSAGWPKLNAQFLQAINSAEWFKIPLYLPEVVLAELEGHWVRAVFDQWRAASSQITTLSRMMKPHFTFNKLPEPPTREELLRKIRQESEDSLKKFVVIPTTTRSLSDFVTMAIFREVTFDDAGRGFRDAIILCSVLDHLSKAQGASAVLVSDDGDFQRPSVNHLTASFNLNLKIVRKLDDLEDLLKKNKNAAIREYLDEERNQLIEALNGKKEEVERYLVENFSINPAALGIGVKSIESLQVISIENAHTAARINSESSAGKPNSVKVSADVKVRLILEIEKSPAIPGIPEERLKVGERITVPPGPPSPLTAGFADFMAKFREVLIVVEADAARDDAGYSGIHFTGAYLKQSNSGFGFLDQLIELA